MEEGRIDAADNTEGFHFSFLYVGFGVLLMSNNC